MTAAYLIKAIRDAGHVCISSDVDERCFGRYLADDFVKMPDKADPALWTAIEAALSDLKIDVVIPSLDDTLQGWADRKTHFRASGISVILSPPETVAICQDKWRTYRFFVEHGIPTPATSLRQEFPLVKPRMGRGTKDVRLAADVVDMTGMISQQYLEGTEYTVDILCDRDCSPIYVVPRRRLNVQAGKSTAGIVEHQPIITSWIESICQQLPFIGPVNIQCIVCPDGSVKFVEVNPRLAGGMALGFAATENWIDLIVRNIIGNETITPKPIRFGLEMKRYYAEVFVPSN